MIALIALTARGADTARRLQRSLPGSQLLGRSGRVAHADRLFDRTLDEIARLHAEGATIVGFCAAGILIRALADTLSNKWVSAPVLAVSEDGGSIVPLVAGHRGGNKLALEIAEILEGHAAITTAGDTRLGFALDDLPRRWTLQTPDTVKATTAALLAGDAVSIKRECGLIEGERLWPNPKAFQETGIADQPNVLITDRKVTPYKDQVVLTPPTLALGIGCERLAPAEGLVAFVKDVVSEAGLSKDAIAAIGTVDLKADEPALKALSKELDRDIRLFSAAGLETFTPHLPNPSDIVFKEIGCHGVSEAAALALAGRDARFVVEKQRRGPYTCAIARARNSEVNVHAGRAPGRLFVVGLGPGDAEHRTSASVSALLQAEEVVGYQLYLDMAADLIGEKPTHESDLGAEEARAAKALALAAEGKTIALVCSGDPGIYALATLVLELMDKAQDRAIRAVDVSVLPGISAFQLAAARLGAPMGHDFCLISLSDLLTPVEAIRQRLNAAAEGDFVTAFYNPQSARRRTLLPETRDIFRRHRPMETPVALCRQLGRPEESITVTRLDDFDTETVDMFTLVIIGSSNTKAFELAGTARAYTPRGYSKKSDSRLKGGHKQGEEE